MNEINHIPNEFQSIVKEINKLHNDNMKNQLYSKDELYEVIKKANEQNEMAMYLVYEMYKSIPL